MSNKLKGKARANARKKANNHNQKKHNSSIGNMMTLIMPDGREQDISMSDMMAEMRVHNKVNVKEVNGIHHVSSSLAESPSKTMAFAEMLMSKYS